MTTTTDERAKVELSVAPIARNSRLLIEGKPLPCTNIQISCKVDNYTMIAAEFAPKRGFEAVIEGEFYNESFKTVHDLKLILGPTFVESQVWLDGEEAFCQEAAIQVDPKDGRTYVTLTDVRTHEGDGFTRVEELTGHLIAR